MSFKLFGIKFRVSFLFTAVLALMTATDKTGELYLFFLAAFIHEAAHLLLMCLLSSKPKEILLIPGGINIVQDGYLSNLKNILILIAGPIANLFCFFLFNDTFALINLLLFIYNILPLGGLDGGRILRTVLASNFNEKTVEIIMKSISIIFVIGFILLFLISLKVNTINLSILIFSLYIISSIFLKKRLKQSEN